MGRKKNSKKASRKKYNQKAGAVAQLCAGTGPVAGATGPDAGVSFGATSVGSTGVAGPHVPSMYPSLGPTGLHVPSAGTTGATGPLGQPPAQQEHKYEEHKEQKEEGKKPVVNAFGADFSEIDGRASPSDVDDVSFADADGDEVFKQFKQFLKMQAQAKKKAYASASSHSEQAAAARNLFRHTPLPRAAKTAAAAKMKKASENVPAFAVESEAPPSHAHETKDEKIARLKKELKATKAQKAAVKVKCCSCESAAACASTLCGCKNTRYVSCGPGCRCQTDAPNGCFNPFTREALEKEFKWLPKGGLVIKECGEECEEWTASENDEE